MHEVDLILTLTGGLAAALACGYVTFRLGLSPIVGYLLAGFVVGPHTPGFVADRALAGQLAEVGVILLMFGVGLQFHLGGAAGRADGSRYPGALVQAPGRDAAGGARRRLARGLGLLGGPRLRPGDLGGEHGRAPARARRRRRPAHPGGPRRGRLARRRGPASPSSCSSLLPAVFGRGGAEPGGVAGPSAASPWPLAVAKVAALVGLVLLRRRAADPLAARPRRRRPAPASSSRSRCSCWRWASPWVRPRRSASRWRLGAFLAGMVVGRSEFSLRAATEALPMRDAFAVLFFVSVGMLFDPQHLTRSPGLVAATLAVILLGKPLAALAIVRLLGHPLRTAASVAVALAQIGEFSFILAAAGRALGILDDAAVNTIVAAAIASITLNPLYYRLARPIELPDCGRSSRSPGRGSRCSGAPGWHGPRR